MKPFIKQVFFLCLLIIVGLGNRVYANGLIDINKNGSITINHIYEEMPLSNARFDIYKIGAISSSGDFSITSAFEKYDIDFEGIEDKSNWVTLADSLWTYIKADNINSYMSLYTDKNGIVKFSDLDIGLYLVVGNDFVYEDDVIKTKPSIVALPTYETEMGDLIYDIGIKTKSEITTSKTKELTVEKVWLNDSGKVRPRSIEVGLYADGKKYDVVTLSSENKWKYKWKQLSNKYEWVVKEEVVPENYKVSYENYNTKITISNQYTKDIIIDEMPQTGVNWYETTFASLLFGVAIILLGISIIRMKARS